MKRYLPFVRGSFFQMLTFRGHFIATFIGNIFYIIVIYYLWKAIYKSTGEVINGMTFEDAFIYLSLAASINMLIQCYTEWNIASKMLNGNIIMDFIRPVNYQLNKLFEVFGVVLANFFVLFIPSIIMITCFFRVEVNISYNILFFIVSLILAIIISFSISFMTGIIAFYTESIWGISYTKDIVVLLLAGAVVPIPFFPDAFRNVLEILPFHSMYNIPLQILTNKNIWVNEYMSYIIFQIVWAIALFLIAALLFKKFSKRMTVNGG